MKIYTVAAIILSVWTVVLAIMGARDKTKKAARTGDIVTSCVGAVLFAVGLALVLSISGGECGEWVRPTAKTFFTVLIPVFALLLTVCIVTSIVSSFNKKLQSGFAHKLRVIMISASSVFLLMLSFLGYIGENESAPLDLYLYMTGAGLACVMRVCSIIENRGSSR